MSLGTPQGKVTFGFGAFMNSVPVPPDPYTMSQIAAATGGKAYTAQTASSVVQIYKTLGSSIGRTHKRVEITQLVRGSPPPGCSPPRSAPAALLESRVLAAVYEVEVRARGARGRRPR